MRKFKIFAFLLLVLGSLGSFPSSQEAFARVGGGRSFGGGARGFYRGGTTRSSEGSRPAQNEGMHRSASSPYSAPQPALPTAGRSSGFLRSLGVGIAGGFLGSMISRALFGGGYGIGMPGGFGILEFLLLLGIGYLVFMFFRRQRAYEPRSEGAFFRSQTRMGNEGAPFPNPREQATDPGPKLDPETAMDLFFQIQGAWANRNLTTVRPILTSEIEEILGEDLRKLREANQINRLENIAVRNVETVEAWQENGRDFETVRYTANLLDYTVDESTQQVVSGSKTQPVKFREYWTFVREERSQNWRLSAIQQDS